MFYIPSQIQLVVKAILLVDISKRPGTELSASVSDIILQAFLSISCLFKTLKCYPFLLKIIAQNWN